MIPDNVTLIVKAPNQQIDDQNVECQSSWTVRQLKGHLSEVYPNKPSTDEQKIIYSGQLLDDNAILKDVLRTYESQMIHTMHLVCTPKRLDPTEGLRKRTVTTVPETPAPERPVEAARPETRQNDQNHTVEMQNYLSSFVNNYGRVPPYPNYMGDGYLPVPNDPAQLANHMMMMQQAYFQYMQQYANLWQAGAAPPAPPPEAPQPAPPAPAPPQEEDDVARDWLDYLYAGSRLMILTSLIYLYGSPARLLLVLLLVAAAYLHHIGFFRDLQLNPGANAANDNRRNEPPANNVNARENNGNTQENNGNAQENNGNAQENTDNAQENNGSAQVNNDNAQENNVNAGNNAAPTVNLNGNQQSLLAVTWMIFSTFFASLIPETNQ